MSRLWRASLWQSNCGSSTVKKTFAWPCPASVVVVVTLFGGGRDSCSEDVSGQPSSCLMLLFVLVVVVLVAVAEVVASTKRRMTKMMLMAMVTLVRIISDSRTVLWRELTRWFILSDELFGRKGAKWPN